ncbi:hypothetical protein Poli38472_006205 [Pythium oligandrum]|uniref:Uncharacterized protein n=1 Tax=Pythium oligandrum TaxID=41045 RepID=A0A8K1CRX6_PYTOL|nr:hypothetical protein Poli38472_006205 [Pythium oligandrum]|eukprot:TMW68737.1 hypothetical protein Poli38472_006205 [Pythium oligandrum]
MVSRNAASNMQVTMETTGLKTDGVVCSPSKPRKKPKQGAGVTLIPITPLHEIPGGSLYVDGQQQRVVYLASLTSTAAEKYFARTNKSTQESEASDEEGEEDVDGSGGVRQRRTKEKPQVQLTSPLRKLLVKLERREKRPVVKDEKKHVSIFDQSHTLDDNNNQRRQEFNTRKPRARGQKQEEDEMVKLKQRIRLMPLTDDDQAEFWALMKQYQKLQMEYRKSVRQDQTSPMTFNVGAAWDKKIREEQHHWWIRAHDERILATLQRKAVEDEKFEQRILESTSEHRAKMRLLRQVREKLMFDAQNVMPTILLCAATHKMFVNLLANWKQRRLEVRLREIVHFWRQERTTRNSNVQAVRVLINWLQKSVAVKSVAFRVFRGIRTYVRRVKQLQRLWKVKIAKRMRNFLIVEKMWTELETAMVDKATEDYEQRLARVEQQAARKKKRAGTKAGSRDNLDKWMTFVTEDLRCEVIREFIRDKENEFSQRFRQQEEELFPHLVQTLRGQNPNRARSYIKAMALGYILLGRVHSVLQNYPGAVDDIPTIQPFDMHEAPIEELIRKARSRSPPDTTGQRFGVQ